MSESLEFIEKRFRHLAEINRVRVSDTGREKFRLYRNEKPENWDKEILSEIYNSFPDNILQRYPDAGPCYKALSTFLDVDEKQIVITSGIDEAIRNLILLTCAQGETFVTNAPQYAMYQLYGKILGNKVSVIDYRPGEEMTAQEIIRAIPENTKLLFIANPGQPVENMLNIEDLKLISEWTYRRNIVFAVDEAYHFFGVETAIPLVNQYDNVIVMRSLSKAFGAASIRLGYIIGCEKLVSYLDSFRLAHESNAFSICIGKILIENFDRWVQPGIETICEGRDYFREECRRLGLSAWGESGNFVLIKFNRKDTYDRVLEVFQNEGIAVKSDYSHPLKQCITVTIGSVALMKPILAVLRLAVQGEKL